MKKNHYIAPTTEIMHLEAQKMIATSLTVSGQEVNSTDNLLSREAYDWDDED